MRILRLVLACGMAMSVLAACGGGDDGGAGVRVDGAWARATPGAATAAAVYMEVTSADGDRLVGAAVEPSVAGVAEIHETVTVDATGTDATGTDTTGGDHADHGATDEPMTMREVESIELPGGEPVTFAPGGLHVMLVDLADPLEEGERFDLTLTFDGADDLVVDVEVRLDAP
jgi:copper(I)-binding protein